MKQYFVAGIGTDVGKTLASSILVEALEADYWKPIQAGELNNTDSMKVRSLISNSKTVIHPEAFLLSEPLSPHAAAEIDEIQIKLKDIILPQTANTLIIEGAGGLMVPINNNDLMIDLIKKLNIEVILVSEFYLGSINHTLLSAYALQSNNIKVAGIIFNGTSVPSSEEFILKHTGLKHLLSINEEELIDKNTILKYKTALKLSL
jgi:dethiobiotin synthetase